MLPDLGADIGGPGHGGLTLRGRQPHQLGILGVHLRDRAGARCRKVPYTQKYTQDQQRDEPRAQVEQSPLHVATQTARLMAKPLM